MSKHRPTAVPGFQVTTDLAKVLPPGESEDDFVSPFNRSIDYLRQEFPNKYINHLCTFAWRAIGNHLVHFGVGQTNLPSIGFMLMNQGGTSHGMIVAPPHWAKLCRQDKHMVRGGICYVASSIADYLQGRLGEFTRIRASAYEAEYYNTTLDVVNETIPFNQHQTAIMHGFSKGLRSLPTGVYYPVQPFLENEFEPLRAPL